MTQQQPSKEQVVRELPAVSKYRVRILEGPRGKVLDVREFVSSQDWSGFTRRGCRFSDRAQVELLRDILTEALTAFPEAEAGKK